MVDDMVGGVGGGVLLDSDLRDMVDLVVDLVSNMMDNWSCGNMVGSRGNSNSWGSIMVSNRSNGKSGSRGNSNSWGSLPFNSLDSWGSIMVSNRSNGKSGSRGNSNSWGSLHFNSLDLSNSWGSN